MKFDLMQKWSFLSQTIQPLSSRVEEPFPERLSAWWPQANLGWVEWGVTGHMLSLVLAGGLSRDPSDHYLGQVLNLLEII